jgi:prepilin-type N-terminal cleavage/methylation domain-containing protein
MIIDVACAGDSRGHFLSGRRPVMLCARRCAQGFTLVELIISAALISLLSLTATFFWVDSFGLVATVNADSAAIADGRAVLERLAREIREVKYDSANGAYCVSTMAARQMVFNKTSDTAVTSCGGVNPTNNDIAVNIHAPVNTTTLNLGYAGTLASPVATQALTTYASSFGIRYLDANYAVTTSASALLFVELSLTVQPTAPIGQATQAVTVVALRND